jgi:hypothetical protein
MSYILLRDKCFHVELFPDYINKKFDRFSAYPTYRSRKYLLVWVRLVCVRGNDDREPHAAILWILRDMLLKSVCVCVCVTMLSIYLYLHLCTEINIHTDNLILCIPDIGIIEATS